MPNPAKAQASPLPSRKAIEKVTAEAPRKKNYRLRQSKIDRAMAILGTRTETETIEQALDMIALRDRLVQGVRNMRGAGLVDIFEDTR